MLVCVCLVWINQKRVSSNPQETRIAHTQATRELFARHNVNPFKAIVPQLMQVRYVIAALGESARPWRVRPWC
jgi:membrane protein insertase Oxa1/YidC/SpoIIIJ